ncbi:hypothetical protein RHCRD62_10766 [Rhodococcus sp. RD6.2]|nr:hypothetical protein RHCRD62_10766 [Rhodococcus sp. RD6.2]
MDKISDLDRFVPVPDPRPVDGPWPELTWPIPADAELTGDVVHLSVPDPDADAAELFRALDHDVVWAHIPLRPGCAEELAELLTTWAAAPDWHAWIVRLRRDVGDTRAGSIVGMTSYLNANVRDAGLEIGATTFTPAVWASGESGVQAAAARLRVRHLARRACPTQDRHPEPPLTAGHRPARRAVRGNAAAPLPPHGRQRPRHRHVLDHGGGLATGGRAPGRPPPQPGLDDGAGGRFVRRHRSCIEN